MTVGTDVWHGGAQSDGPVVVTPVEGTAKQLLLSLLPFSPSLSLPPLPDLFHGVVLALPLRFES